MTLFHRPYLLPRLFLPLISLMIVLGACEPEEDAPPSPAPKPKKKKPTVKLKDVRLKNRVTGYFLYMPKVTGNKSLIDRSRGWLRSLEIDYTYIGQVDLTYIPVKDTVVFIPFFYRVPRTLMERLYDYVKKGGRVIFLDGPIGALSYEKGKELVGASQYYIKQHQEYNLKLTKGVEADFFSPQTVENVSGHVVFDYGENTSDWIRFTPKLNAVYANRLQRGKVLVINWHAEPLFANKNQKYIDTLCMNVIRKFVGGKTIGNEVRAPIKDIVSLVIPRYSRINFYNIYPAYLLADPSLSDEEQGEVKSFLAKAIGKKRFSVIRTADLPFIPSRSILYTAGLRRPSLMTMRDLIGYIQDGGTWASLDAPLFLGHKYLENIIGESETKTHDPEQTVSVNKQSSALYVRHINDGTALEGFSGDYLTNVPRIRPLLMGEGIPLLFFSRFMHGSLFFFNYRAYRSPNKAFARFNQTLVRYLSYYQCGFRYPQKGYIDYIRSIVTFNYPETEREPSPEKVKPMYLFTPSYTRKKNVMIKTVEQFARHIGLQFQTIDEKRLRRIPQDSLVLVPALHHIRKKDLEHLAGFVHFGGDAVFLGAPVAFTKSRYSQVHDLIGTRNVQQRSASDYRLTYSQEMKEIIGAVPPAMSVKGIAGYHLQKTIGVKVLARFNDNTPALLFKKYGKGRSIVLNWYLPSSYRPAYVRLVKGIMDRTVTYLRGEKRLRGRYMVDLTAAKSFFKKTVKKVGGTQKPQLYVADFSENDAQKKHINRFFVFLHRNGLGYGLVTGDTLDALPDNSVLLVPYLRTVLKTNLAALTRYILRGGRVFFWGPPAGIAVYKKWSRILLGGSSLTVLENTSLVPRYNRGNNSLRTVFPKRVTVNGTILKETVNSDPVYVSQRGTYPLLFARHFKQSKILVLNTEGRIDTHAAAYRQLLKRGLSFLADEQTLFPPKRTMLSGVYKKAQSMTAVSAGTGFLWLEQEDLRQIGKRISDITTYCRQLGIKLAVIKVHNKKGHTVYPSRSIYHKNLSEQWREEKKLSFKTDFLLELTRHLQSTGIQVYYSYSPGTEKKLAELYPAIGQKGNLYIRADRPSYHHKEVLDHWRREVREIVSKYPCDGFIIDDTVFPPFRSLHIEGTDSIGSRDRAALKGFVEYIKNKQGEANYETVLGMLSDHRRADWQKWLDFHWGEYRQAMSTLYRQVKSVRDIPMGYKVRFSQRGDRKLMRVFDFVAADGGYAAAKTFYRTRKFRQYYQGPLWLVVRRQCRRCERVVPYYSSFFQSVWQLGFPAPYRSPWYTSKHVPFYRRVLSSGGSYRKKAAHILSAQSVRVAIWDGGNGELLPSYYYNMALNLLQKRYRVRYCGDWYDQIFQRIHYHTHPMHRRLWEDLSRQNILIVPTNPYAEKGRREYVRAMLSQYLAKGGHIVTHYRIAESMGWKPADERSATIVRFDGDTVATRFQRQRGTVTAVSPVYRKPVDEFVYSRLADRISRPFRVRIDKLQSDDTGMTVSVRPPRRESGLVYIRVPLAAQSVKMRMRDTTVNVDKLELRGNARQFKIPVPPKGDSFDIRVDYDLADE